MNKIIQKPWGYEEILEINKYYCLKKLFMKKNNRCSLQYHKKKIETIFVIKGVLEIEINKIKKIFKKNQSITIKNNVIHRMKALKVDTIYLESSTNHLKDLVRIEDDFKRN